MDSPRLDTILENISGWLDQLFATPAHHDQQTLVYLLVSLVVVVVIIALLSISRSCSISVPIINPGKRLSFYNVDAKRAFLTGSKTLMSDARKLYPGQPYKIITDVGEVLVLPPTVAEEIRNNSDLNLARAMEVVWISFSRFEFGSLLIVMII
ncbi:hypothetical protein BDV97DRAFT_397066 [Delphinella strobiligena]|nr:hypothetical protein BDV97DRAFT_397066 [Delphinella strobiligena]